MKYIKQQRSKESKSVGESITGACHEAQRRGVELLMRLLSGGDQIQITTKPVSGERIRDLFEKEN